MQTLERPKRFVQTGDDCDVCESPSFVAIKVRPGTVRLDCCRCGRTVSPSGTDEGSGRTGMSSRAAMSSGPTPKASYRTIGTQIIRTVVTVPTASATNIIHENCSSGFVAFVSHAH